MQIGVMRMVMCKRLMKMFVRMGLNPIPCTIVMVRVMRIVRMRVRVRHRLVRMLMLVPLGQMQPHAAGHQ